MAETARFNPKTYFETDPQELGDTTTLSGALGGLLKAGTNLIGNVGVRGYNAVGKALTPTTTFAERTAAFPAANVRRYQPQGVAPVAPAAAPSARPDFPAHLERDILAMDKGSAPAPASPRPSLRRASRAPAGVSISPPEATVSYTTPTDYAAGFAAPSPEGSERGYIEQDGVKMYIPGSKAYDGVGATGPAQFESAPSFRKQAGDVGYTGSQEEWENDQTAAKINSRPFGFKTAAAQLALRQQGETEANNLRTFGVNQQNADTLTEHYQTQNRRSNALLPGEVATQGASLRKAALDAKNQELVNEFYPAATQADIEQKKGLTGYYRQVGNAAEAKSGNDTAVERLQMTIDQQKAALEAKSDDAELKLLAANDPNFNAKYAASGGTLAGYKAAERRATELGAVFKPAPFKSGVIGFRTTNNAGWYTPDGKAVSAADLTSGNAVVATATDAKGQKWVKYADGRTAKAN